MKKTTEQFSLYSQLDLILVSFEFNREDILFLLMYEAQ